MSAPTWRDPGSGQCFLTQNQFGNTDVDGGSVVLTSPALARLGQSDLSISYLYYLNLTNESSNDFLRVAVSTNGLAGPFVNVVSHAANGNLTWCAHEITSAHLAAAGVGALTNDVRVRFTANDAIPASIVEAGVDGLSITTVTCTPGGLGTNYRTSGALGSQIFATGSASIAANDLVLHANAIPNTRTGSSSTAPASSRPPSATASCASARR